MPDEIGKSLIETIEKSDLTEIIIGRGDKAVETLVDSDALNDIPILGTIIKIGKTVNNIRDYIFLNRLMAFISGISQLSIDDRKRLVTKLKEDENFGEYTGQKIIECIARLDDNKKPKFMAVAFQMFLREEIDSATLMRINYAIERVIMCDIPKLEEFYKRDQKDRIYNGNMEDINFVTSGLAFFQIGYGGAIIIPTQITEIFIKIIKESGI